MRRPKLNRLILVLLLITSISIGVWVILSNLSSNIMFFYTPTELSSASLSPTKLIKVGGKVKPGSFKRKADMIEFVITDCNEEIMVNYKGFLPPMFRDGQGVVAEGVMDKNRSILIAKRLLTKHDENYQPPSLKGKLDSQNICAP